MCIVATPNQITFINSVNHGGTRWLNSDGAPMADSTVALIAWSIYAVVVGLGVVMFWWGRLAARADHQRYEREEAEFTNAMQRWNRLYYCGRCDLVFDPTSATS